MRNTLSLALLVCVCTTAMWAQSVAGNGAVTGNIRDSYGEGLPDSAVALSNDALGIRRLLESTGDGLFNVPALAPGKGYKIEVSRKGFVTWQSPEFEVFAGETLGIQVSLQLLAPATQAEATATEPKFETIRDGLTAQAGPEKLDGLPMQSRRWSDLTLLAPGVVPDLTLGAPAVRGAKGANQFMTDGLITSSGYDPSRYGQPANVPLDSVESFQTVSSNASVEFARALGGFVNTVTRSGSNTYHGSAYEYFSNHSLSAIDRYALGNQLFQRRNQGGASFGGPTTPGSKLFYFANVEFLDGHHQGLNRITNPLLVDSTGTSVLSSNCQATAAQCAAAVKFIQGQMNVLVPRSEHWLTGLVRLDYRRSDHHVLSLVAGGTHGRSPEGPQNQDVAPNGGLLGNDIVRRDTTFGKLNWTATSNAVVNELRIGVFQDRVGEMAGKSNLSTENTGITIAGTVLGATNPSYSSLSEHRTQVTENFRFSLGTHSILLGGDVAKSREWVNRLDDAYGRYNYASLTNFATDFSGGTTKSYLTFNQQVGTPTRMFRPSQLSLYFQDSWAVSPKWHVTFGARWERAKLPQPMVHNSTYYQTANITPTGSNVDPRIGITYRRTDKSIFRVSYGMFHSAYTADLVDALYTGNGVMRGTVIATPTSTNAPVFRNVIASRSAIPTGTASLAWANQLRNPYTAQTLIEYERQLARNTTLTVTYLGSRGLKMWTATDLNISSPTKRALYSIADASGTVVSQYSTLLWTNRDNTKFSRLFQIGNQGSVWYHAGVARVQHTMSHGVSVQGSYTWSHTIDDLGENRAVGNIPWNTANADHGFDRGNSTTDQRHRAVIDILWRPTLGSDFATPLRAAVNGWEVSAISTIASGLSFTPATIVYGQQFLGLTMDYTSSMNGTGSWNRMLTLPVGSLHGDPQHTVNARLARTFSITERVKAKLLFEAFNALNSQFDTSVNTIAYTATSGLLKPVTGVGLGNASRGYPNGTNARSGQVALRLTF
jgi:hypothetical protein